MLPYLAIFLLLSLPIGCFYQHEDDLVPTPVVITAISPSFELVNAAARAKKKIVLTVEILEAVNCFSGYNLAQSRLNLTPEGDAQNSIRRQDAPKKNTEWIERLVDGSNYVVTLTYEPTNRTLDTKTFRASQEDRTVSLTSPCRQPN